MNIAMQNALSHVLERAEQAGHGKKQTVYQQAANEMGISIQTLQRKLKELRSDLLCAPRKQRSDKGKSALTRKEAVAISAYLTEATRNQDKGLASVKEALKVLRANGEIVAAKINEETGECKFLSSSAVLRALTNYRLHPRQLKQPAAKSRLASRHPNQLWQIDPSLCVLYYLPSQKGQGVQVMDEKAFYKNKPANIRKIEKERVWRYVITDHTSSLIFVHYVLGAESAKNLVDSFILATQQKDKSPFHGIPKMVMVDPGSANTSATFRNLCHCLGVELLVNKPGQPWAKGQVEKANDIVERSFEHRMRIMAEPPSSLDEINELAQKWSHWFNGTQTLVRTQSTRYETWLRIKQDELILAPSAEIMQQLAHSAVESRKLNIHLEFEFATKHYSVKHIKHLMVGDTVEVARNAWLDDSVQVISQTEDGKKRIHTLKALKENEFGFTENSAYVGEEYKGQSRTVLDDNREEIERFVMNAATDEEAKTNRKRKAPAFGGRVDPMKHIEQEADQMPNFMKKRGNASDIDTKTQIEEPIMTCVQAAMQLRRRVKQWQPSYMQWLEQRYPDGVKDSQIDELVKRIDQGITAPLKSVGGKS